MIYIRVANLEDLGDALRALADLADNAAAPELLAALEGLMEWEDEIAVNLALHTNPAPLMAKARAALAKARRGAAS